MPNVRLKPPSAPKKDDIAALRSSRFGDVRSSLKPAWSTFTVRPSLSVIVGYGKSAFDRMP